MFIREIILNKLREVIHPEGGGDIVTQGLVKAINLSDQRMEIVLRLRSEPKSTRRILRSFIFESLIEYGKNFSIRVKFEKVRNTHQTVYNEINSIPKQSFQKIAISSTNGGIGQSSFSVNLAVALSKFDYRVGLLDADLFGPDLMAILATDNEPFYINKKVYLFRSFGICILSLRKLMEEKGFVNWRESCVEKCFQEVLHEIESEDLNLVLFNLPPGAGDAQLALAQYIGFNGAIIVSSSQDAFKAGLNKIIHLYQENDIPILGVLEDSSYIDQNFTIIQSDQSNKNNEIRYLGNIPLEVISRQAIAKKSPAVVRNGKNFESFAFNQIAGQIKSNLFH
jgi:ATP-binding protein involved in chromosome partitioning